jgi:hypothetical protein
MTAHVRNEKGACLIQNAMNTIAPRRQTLSLRRYYPDQVQRVCSQSVDCTDTPKRFRLQMYTHYLYPQ